MSVSEVAAASEIDSLLEMSKLVQQREMTQMVVSIGSQICSRETIKEPAMFQ